MKITSILIFWVLSLFGGSLLHAESAPQLLRIAVIEVGKPTGYLDRGRPAGTYYDISDLLFQHLGHPYQLEMVPYKRMVQGLNKGQYDCAIFFTSPERSRRYTQVGEVIRKEVIAVIAPPRSGEAPLQVRSVADMEGLEVGYIRGAGLGRTFGKEIHSNERIRKQGVDSYSSGLKMLQTGRIDLFIGGRETIESIYDHQGRYLKLMEKSSWLQCSRHSSLGKTELAQLQQRLKQMQDDALGEASIAAIMRRYRMAEGRR